MYGYVLAHVKIISGSIGHSEDGRKMVQKSNQTQVPHIKLAILIIGHQNSRTEAAREEKGAKGTATSGSLPQNIHRLNNLSRTSLFVLFRFVSFSLASHPIPSSSHRSAIPRHAVPS